MSRRDGRDSDTRRHRSRFDLEPSPKRSRRNGKPETERTLGDVSPKRSRRDGKPETERSLGDVISDKQYHLSGDQKHRRRLQDTVPLEAPSKEVYKEEVIINKESDKAQANREGKKYSSDPTEVPRSRTFFQHDERGNSGVAGRNIKHRTSADCDLKPTKEGGWERDPKEKQIVGDERVRSRHARDNDAWRHDKYMETEVDPKPAARKRPSFREKKIENDSERVDKSVVVEPVKTTRAYDQPLLVNERRDERGGGNNNNSTRHLDRSERPGGNNLDETRRGGNFPPRGRYGNHREREQLVGRQGRGYHSAGGVEKWKHDLFHEANRSPSPKNEDDAIAKVEALLAS